MAEIHPTNPHGHTARNARHEGRIRVRVWMREDQMSQMLPDGRGYSGPGPHEIEIYKSDLRNLDVLVEKCTASQLAEISDIVAERTAEWCRETRLSAAECPINFPAEYRLRYRRDLNPVVRYERVGDELGTIAAQEDADRAAAITAATGAASNASNAQLAAMVASEVAKVMAGMQRGNDGNKGGR